MPRPARPLRSSSLPGTLIAICAIGFAAGCNSSDPAPAETADAKKAPAPPDVDGRSDAGDGSRVPGAAAAEGDMPPAPADRSVAESKDVPPGSDPLVPAGVTRETTEGWWRIVFAVNGQDFSAGFVRIGKDGQGGYGVEEVRANDIINPAKPVADEATDKTVRIAFKDGENEFDFAGALDGNVIRGNLQFKSPRQILVRLVPVKESDITDEALDEKELGTTFGLEQVAGSLQSDDPVARLREVAKTWKTSPVLFMAYDALLQNATALDIDRPTLEELAAEFKEIGEIWGERAGHAASLNAAAGLLVAGYETEFADQLLARVREEAPELAANWEELIETARKHGIAEKERRERLVAIDAAVAQIDGGQVEPGIEALRALYVAKPADPIAPYRLAVAEREHGSKDEALRLFARLAALPQTEMALGQIAAESDYAAPRSAASKLYQEKTGSRDGFEDFLGEVYRETITSFLTEQDRNRQPTESARTVLVELFTGATCPPCIAADVATEAVERSFPGSDVTVLRYHLHIPGPDPLVNADSEARSEYYGDAVQGTPTIFVDGATLPYNIGGLYSNSPEIYAQLAETIAGQAATPPAATVELKAAVEGPVLRIAARASAEEAASDSLRLRVVVAESHIGYTARNGIREHEMVVREMPGGAAGVAAVDGSFAFEQEIPLVELRDRLVSYLDEFEGRLGGSFEFGERPLALRRLTVVAFLQDDATQQMLQTAVAPIEQEIELPPVSTRRADDPEPAGPTEEAAEGDEGPSLSPPQE